MRALWRMATRTISLRLAQRAVSMRPISGIFAAISRRRRSSSARFSARAASPVWRAPEAVLPYSLTPRCFQNSPTDRDRPRRCRGALSAGLGARRCAAVALLDLLGGEELFLVPALHDLCPYTPRRACPCRRRCGRGDGERLRAVAHRKPAFDVLAPVGVRSRPVSESAWRTFSISSSRRASAARYSSPAAR